MSARYTDAKVSRAVTAGIEAIDLFKIAQDDVLRRAHLLEFLRAALAYLETSDPGRPVPHHGSGCVSVLKYRKDSR